MKYTVIATISVDVTATVEAEDVDDAQSILESADATVGSCDKNITFNSAILTACEVDSVSCVGEEMWNSLSKSERMEILNGNGATDDAAYEIAGRSFDNVPHCWQGYFE